jgi:predicted DNA-binding transcriptional regulator YafY
MAADKSERLLNLIFILLNASKPVPRSRLRQVIDSYRSSKSDASFERMFERDKEDLRTLGFQLEVTPANELSGDEIGYWISQSDSLLSLHELSLSQKALLKIAYLSAQSHDQVARSTLLKLEAGAHLPTLIEGFVSVGQISNLTQSILLAISSKRKTSFEYKGISDEESKLRTVTPLHMTIHKGSWYLIAFDHERLDQRVFRLDRIHSKPTLLEIDSSVYPNTKQSQLAYLLNNDENSVLVKVILPTHLSSVFDAFKVIEKKEISDSLELILKVSDTALFLNLVLGHAPLIQVTDPQIIKDQLRTRIIGTK